MEFQMKSVVQGKTFLSTAVLLILTAFLCSMQNAVTFLGGEPLTDASVFRYMGSVILGGGMPYRDSFDHKGPVVYLLDALGMKLSYWKGIWVISFLLLLVAVIFFYKTARLAAGKKSALLATISSMLMYSAVYQQGGEMVEDYALPFLAIAGYIFTDYYLNQRISFIRLIICGFTFGVVLLIRPNIAGLWVIMCLGVLVQCIRNREFQSLGKYLLGFIAGTLAVVIPVFQWLYMGNAFDDFIKDYLIFNSSYTADSSSYYGKLETLARFTLNSVVLLCICYLAFQIKIKKRVIDLVWLLTLCLNLIFISISGKYFLHYGITLVPSFIYPLALINEQGVQADAVNYRPFFAAVWTALFIPLLVQSAMQIRTQISHTGLSEDTDKVVQMVKQSTHVSDPITVFGNDDLIYIASERQSASRYSYQSPIGMIDPSIMDSYFEELEMNVPNVVVVSSESSLRKDDYERMYLFLNVHSYEKAGESGDLSVYVLGKQ
ncbi:ArnT family glycosyltransferase [Galactobacillus timonensis]|uniref:ArnT family glycosyltransferase n=1 Tax=Galactobacillus timonensis TaxID=2041840 RepID=UPI001436C961|nr:glycosyltransferase family 39 protein [Galactobacillus timonensis]